MVTAYIGLGSNAGDRLGNLAGAVESIGHIPLTHVEEVSHAYESEPAYVLEQANFFNAAVEVSTGLEPEALLEHLLRIEDEMGRARDMDKGPRTIDLDLLLYDDEEISSPNLTVPHEGLTERAFVVWPLLEIAPGLHLPGGER
ncbi:MAG: 2-amino-4-hydroxy-6-hydroxymethyldihydropteridine diphosphokinase, partial [Actinobacteria bacterium]